MVPPTGFVYTDYKAPISLGSKELGSKRGLAHVTTILAMISWGDGSIRAATNNGRIRNLKHVDYQYYNVLGVFQRYTTIAYGD